MKLLLINTNMTEQEQQKLFVEACLAWYDADTKLILASF